MEKLEVCFILVVCTILFSLFIQSYGSSFTGLTTFNDNFGIEASAAPVVNATFPKNNTNWTTSYINFTYNVSDPDTGGDSVDNCTLFLNIDSAGFNANMTHYSTWVNQSNGVSAKAECESEFTYGITTNGSDFWIVESGINWVYHLNLTYDNQSTGPMGMNGTNVGVECGAADANSITTNGSDFWIIDGGDDFIYHLNSSWDNQSDRMNGTDVGVVCGADDPYGITTNGSDFWITDATDNFVYHLNSTLDNDTRTGLEGFNVGVNCGSDNPYSITTNGSDFWIVDRDDNFVYHVNASGDNQSDGFSTVQFGAANPFGITIFSLGNLGYQAGKQPEFWITDDNDNFLYHIKDQVEQTVNHTFNITFGVDRNVLWKVGCYDNNSYQGNSSEYNLTVDITVPAITLQTPKNNTNWTTSYINFTYNVTDDTSTIDSCILWRKKSGSATWELNSTDSSITEVVNQSINITIEDSNFLWRIECNDTLNNRGNSTTRNITVDTRVTYTTGGGHSGVSSKSSSKTATVTQDLTSTVEFSNPNIPVISVDLKLNKEADLQVTVRKIFESFLSQKLENAYSYFALETNLDNSYFDHITLNFKVRKAYENVELHMLSDQGNYKIDSTKIYQDRDHNYYQANVNTLGYFAITASEKKEPLSLSGKATKTLDEIKVKTGLIAGLLILVLFILVFFYMKHKKIKFNQH